MSTNRFFEVVSLKTAYFLQPQWWPHPCQPSAPPLSTTFPRSNNAGVAKRRPNNNSPFLSRIAHTLTLPPSQGPYLDDVRKILWLFCPLPQVNDQCTTYQYYCLFMGPLAVRPWQSYKYAPLSLDPLKFIAAVLLAKSTRQTLDQNFFAIAFLPARGSRFRCPLIATPWQKKDCNRTSSTDRLVICSQKQDGGHGN